MKGEISYLARNKVSCGESHLSVLSITNYCHCAALRHESFQAAQKYNYLKAGLFGLFITHDNSKSFYESGCVTLCVLVCVCGCVCVKEEGRDTGIFNL